MSSKLSRRRLIKTAASLGAAAAFITISPSNVFATGKKLLVRIPRDLQNLDPANRTGPIEVNVILAVYQGLIKPKLGTLEFENDAAASIAQVSDTLIEFTLKDNLMFSGGFGQVTAQDVKFSFERFIKPGPDGKKVAFADDWAVLDSVEVTGPLSGRIHLKGPKASLWTTTLADGSGVIVSKKAFQKFGGKISANVIGSGPYMLAESTPGTRFVLTANPDFKGPKSHFEEIDLRPITELRTAELAFLGRELDFTQIDPVRSEEIGKSPATKIIKKSGIDYVWIGPNIAKPPFDKHEVREALRLAIDVDAILAGAYNGFAPRANAILAPELLGDWKDAPVRARDVEAAKALLAKAGLGSGFKTRLTILNTSVFQAIAAIVQANLADVGIDLEIDSRDSGAYWALGENDASKDLDLSLIEFPGKMDAGFQMQWFTTSQIGLWNWQRWSNPEFDALFVKAEATLDDKKRSEIYVQMQQLMDKSAAFIWITYNVYTFASVDTLTPAILPSGSNLLLQDFVGT
ncbi:ABC transporter substrate-binding protein [Mesorhizobium hawassense]|uniref:ABC transporter substrate-binding protein n=1 Tax=Mesorhizobium hawassense TaxID=1209954 RepID=A0A330HVS0_9HYPH|nr:ABC transporter substrate-binding protein [Mesorhizobium hawassense]RAZ91742.1 ABC transporter substrate-binding protein [Mesorhizobium hawassense]